MLEQTSTQLVMLYYMDRKKHLPGRIVPLGVPFPGYACGNAHVRTANDGAGYQASGIYVVINEYIFCSPTEYSLKDASFRFHPV